MRARQLRTATMLALMLACHAGGAAQGWFRLASGETVAVECASPQPGGAVSASAAMLREDLGRVLAANVVSGGEGAAARKRIIIGTREEAFPHGRAEAFRLSLAAEGTLLVEGSDDLGTAFGTLELSRRLGVTPWEWWAEAEVPTLEDFALDLSTPVEEAPYVEHRGIFINDEDFSLAPWASRTQPRESGGEGRWRYEIGPLVTERICQLLLRLKADTYWPAMHECTKPFFLTAGDSEVLRRYGIFLGTSHCEPMLCNALGEWNVRGEGDYNFATNAGAVTAFWQARLDEAQGQPVIYTLGMRGIHDGPMEGATTVEECKELLERVLLTQESMLDAARDSGAQSAERVFIPYKEVLDAVDAGLRIPADAAVIQCDDNYGYIRWPADSMLSRPAGTGLYYHVSYWGRPHDYLWLSTTHPRVEQEELTRFALAGRQRLWVLNVGDIKPAEYQTQLFMDIAWNPRAFADAEAWRRHLADFLARNLCRSLAPGEADSLAAVMARYYDIVFERRPEFLAGTRTEEADPAWKRARDLPWSASRLRAYSDSLLALSDAVERESPSVAWTHLVQYPVQGAAQMALKHVEATLARHGMGDWEASDRAHDSIQTLTARYNTGRWEGFMNAAPRGLTVFRKAARDTATTPLPRDEEALLTVLYRDSLTALTSEGQPATLLFSTPEEREPRPLDVEVSVLPTHPRHGERLCLHASLDGGEPRLLDFTTRGRSEEWKENVLSNRATRQVTLTPHSAGSHTLVLSPVSGGEIFLLQVTVTER